MFHEDKLDAFRLKEKLNQSSSLIQAGIVGFYGLNAFLTFVYCAFVVWFWLKPELDFTGLAGFAIVSLLFGGATLLLLDGARALWAAGRVAQNTTSWQQGIAWGMEILNFVGSLLASVIALRFIWQIFGTTQVTAVESGTESMTTLLTAALTINLIAAFFYNQMSVTARQLQTVARAGAKFSDQLTTGLAVLLQDAKSDVPALLEPYAQSLKNQHANDAVNKVLTTYGYDPAQDPNIIDVTPEEEPLRYSVHYLNEASEQCNTAVIHDLEKARLKATDLALDGMRFVQVKDFDGNPVWPVAGALNTKQETAVNGTNEAVRRILENAADAQMDDPNDRQAIESLFKAGYMTREQRDNALRYLIEPQTTPPVETIPVNGAAGDSSFLATEGGA